MNSNKRKVEYNTIIFVSKTFRVIEEILVFSKYIAEYPGMMEEIGPYKIPQSILYPFYRNGNKHNRKC